MIPLQVLVPRRTTPWITWFLIAANTAVFLHELSLPEGLLHGFVLQYGFVPARLTLALSVAVVAGLSLVLGFLMAAGFRAWLAQLQAGRPIDPLAPVASILPSLLGLLLNPFTLITVILAVVLAVSRVR